ncbi:hypothetical protein D3C71_1962990 [compost metagenome]
MRGWADSAGTAPHVMPASTMQAKAVHSAPGGNNAVEPTHPHKAADTHDIAAKRLAQARGVALDSYR